MISRRSVHEGVVRGVLDWVRSRGGTPPGPADRVALTGGVSGAPVERWTVRLGSGDAAPTETLVVKQTTRAELEALEALAALDEPAIPRPLATGDDGTVAWLVMPWHPGRPVPVDDDPPAGLGTTMARVHTHFLGRPSSWPSSAERIDEEFLDRALAGFVPDVVAALPPAGDVTALGRRALDAARRLHGDSTFRAALAGFPATLLHGDLYGGNVLVDDTGGFLVIDWATVRVGPALFDVAMATTDDRSAMLRAYRDERRRLGGPDPLVDAELAWCRTLVDTVFAAVVAARWSACTATTMLDRAEDSRRRVTISRRSG